MFIKLEQMVKPQSFKKKIHKIKNIENEISPTNKKNEKILNKNGNLC